MPGEGHICFEEKVWKASGPVVFEDLEATRFLDIDPNIRKFGFKSFIGTSVPIEGGIPRCLCMFDTRKRPFLSSDIDRLVTLSRVLSLEEKQRQSYQHLKNRLSDGELLFEISSRAISLESLKDFLDECLEIVGKAFDVGGIFVWKYDAESDTVSNVAKRVADESAFPRDNLQDIPAVLFPWDLEEVKREEIIQYDDIDDLMEGRDKEAMQSQKIRSMLMFPLFNKKIFYGTLGIESYDHPRRWRPHDIPALTAVSNIMTKSIEGYLADQELRKAKDELEKQVKRRTEKLRSAVEELEREHRETLLRETELEDLSQELLEMNKAITVLARNVKREKTSAEREVSLLISSKILPLVKDLRECRNLEERRSELDVIYAYLNEIGVGMARESSRQIRLTVTEMKVASLINKGFTSPQIANKLNVSLETIKTHRKRIRKKLKVQNTDVNLASYLNSFFQTEGSEE